MDFPTQDEFFRIAEDAILGNNGKLTRAAVETPGTDIHGIAQLAAVVGNAIVGEMKREAAGFYIDAATEELLDRRVLDSVGLLRVEEAAAYVSVDFSTTAPALINLPIPQDTVLVSTDGNQWVTTEAVVFPRLSRGPLTVNARSYLTGSNQYARSGTITSIKSQIANAPADLVVTNPKASTVGSGRQQDGPYRGAYRGFFNSAARGTLVAIEQRALRVPGVQTARATEILDGAGLPSKKVLLGITDSFTDRLIDLTTIPPTYLVQSQVLAQVVYKALDDTRAGGTPVLVQLAKVVIQPIELSLAFVAGVNINDVAYRTRVAVVNYVNSLKRGQSLLVRDLNNVLTSIRGLAQGSNVRFPSGDIIVKPLQVLRTELAFTTAGASQEDRPLVQSSSADA